MEFKALAAIGKALSATPAALEALRANPGFFAFPRSAYVDGAFISSSSASYAAIYAKQTNVRTVIDVIAEAAADRKLKLYEREPNGDREEDGDHPAADTLRHPNDWQGQTESLRAVMTDYLIYDDAFYWDLGAVEEDRRYLVRVPPYAMGVSQKNRLKPSGYRVMFNNGSYIDLTPQEVIHFRGYSAQDGRQGTSRMETLRQLIVEESVRQAQSIDFLKSGMVKGGIIERPLEAPEWSAEARERFEEGWAGRLKGVLRGKSPVLEEGMVFKDAGVTPREAESIKNRELNMATVCRAYGVHPSYFGIESAGADIVAARDALEEDVAMPLAQRFAEALTVQLVGDVYNARQTHFFEFSWRELPGRQIRQYEGSNKATGGPVITVNEYRKMVLNLPPIEGGDELISQSNTVRAGGELPSPSEMPLDDNSDRGRPEGSEDLTPRKSEDLERDIRDDLRRIEHAELERKALEAKAYIRRNAAQRRREAHAADHAAALRKHFRRQLRASKALDSARWDKELADDLYRLATKTVGEEGEIVSARLMGSFDMSQVENYLRVGSKAAASQINASTADSIREARGKDDVAVEVLTAALSERADSLGVGRATALFGFATHEAAKQNDRQNVRRKTWVGSGLPDSRHSGVSGQSVPLFQSFSNGLQYPGDPSGTAAQTAGCRCLLDVS